MPGQGFSHTTRTPGTVLTADIYNGDFTNITTHLEPQYIDDESSSLTNMRTSTDPGESASEVLATSLRDEIRQLRHMLTEMKGTIYWYETFKTRRLDAKTLPCIDMATQAGYQPLFVNGKYIETRASFLIRDDFPLVGVLPTTISVDLLYHSQTDTTGTVEFEYIVRVQTIGIPAVELANTATTVVNPLFNTISSKQLYVISAGTVLANDFVQVIVRRDALGLGGDSFAGDIRPHSIRLTYQGYAGRAS